MMHRQKRSPMWRTATPVLWPLALLYAAGVRFKNAAFDCGFAKSRRLLWPVISVGNVSLGGTGKTPVVLLLAELLQSRGWIADVLSRGYGRASQSVERVDPTGGPEKFGDEPLLMARRGIPVYVGADRHRAGQLAEQEQLGLTGPQSARAVHLLDDGFQHRKLARDVNIVLLRREDLEDEMLPAGRLREPLRALERADICILRAQDADLAERALRLMRKDDSARVWIVERRMIVPGLPGKSLSNSTAVAFCAIGDPEEFFQGLEKAGVVLADTIAFRDHHVYTHGDIEHLKTGARRCGASCFVTTEKDNMRLTDTLRNGLELPLIVAGLTIALQEEARSMAMLEFLLSRQL